MIYGKISQPAIQKIRLVISVFRIYKHKKTKLKDEVGMAVPKVYEQDLLNITSTMYTSLRLLFSIISCTSDSICS